MTETKKQMQGGSIALVALLGLLTAVDSLGIDMYLPAFGAMESDYGLAAGSMSLSLSFFMCGLAVGQGVCGPLADRWGRRRPLFAGILLFGLASAAATVSTSFEMLLAARFVQGLGGAACLVIPRTITSDLYDEKESATIFTILMQVQSVCPILAPVIGAYLLLHVQWQGIFWILAVCGGLGALAVWLMVPETGKQNETENNDFGNAVKRLIGCRRYWLMTLSFASLMGALFSYIGSSSFIYVTLFQASATEFSLYFGLNSLGVIAFGLISVRMLRVMPLKRALALSFAVHSIACFLLVVALAVGLNSKIATIVLLFFVVASLGLLFGGLTSETMYSVPRDLAGAASAVLGVLQYAAASLSGLVIGWFQAKTLMPIAAVLTGFTMVSVLLWFLGSRVAKPDDLTGHAREMGKEPAS